MKKHIRPAPLFEIGDLVSMLHEEDRVWEVEGHYYEYMFLHGKESENMYYNLLCVNNNESRLGEENELGLLCPVDFSESYLRNLKLDNTIIKWLEVIQPNSMEEVETMNRSSSTKFKLTKAQKEKMADEVLDRYNDTMKFIDLDGEVTDIMKQQLDKLKEQWERVVSATIID